MTDTSFAVVRAGGKQYLVCEGGEIEVSGILGKESDRREIKEVLLLNTGKDLQIGTPLVEGAAVQAAVIFAGKGPKLHVFKFKAKSRYRRKMGFRPLVTRLRILGVGSGKPINNEIKDNGDGIKGKKKEIRKRKKTENGQVAK